MSQRWALRRVVKLAQQHADAGGSLDGPHALMELAHARRFGLSRRRRREPDQRAARGEAPVAAPYEVPRGPLPTDESTHISISVPRGTRRRVNGNSLVLARW